MRAIGSGEYAYRTSAAGFTVGARPEYLTRATTTTSERKVAQTLENKSSSIKEAMTRLAVQRVTQSVKSATEKVVESYTSNIKETLEKSKTTYTTLAKEVAQRSGKPQPVETAKTLSETQKKINEGLNSIKQSMENLARAKMSDISKQPQTVGKLIDNAVNQANKALSISPPPSQVSPTRPDPPQAYKEYASWGKRVGAGTELFWDESRKQWDLKNLIQQPQVFNYFKPRVDALNRKAEEINTVRMRNIVGIGGRTYYHPDHNIVVKAGGFQISEEELVKAGAVRVDGEYGRLRELHGTIERAFNAARTTINAFRGWPADSAVRTLNDIEKFLSEGERAAREAQTILSKWRSAATRPTERGQQPASRTPTTAPPPDTHTKTSKATEEKPIPVTDTVLIQLKSKKDALIRDLESKKSELSLLEAERGKLGAMISSLEGRITYLISERNSLSARISELQSMLQQLPSMTESDLIARIQSVKAEIESLRVTKTQLEQMISQAESRIEELKRRLREQGISFYAYQQISIRRPGVTQGGYIAGKFKEVLVPETVKSPAELEELKRRLSADIERESRELSDIVAKIPSVRSVVEELKNKVNSLRATLSSLESEVKDLDRIFNELKSRVGQAASGRLRDLIAQLTGLESERSRLEAEVSELRIRLESLTSEESRLTTLLGAIPTAPPPTIPTLPPTIPTIPTLPPTTPSPDVSALLDQFNTLQQQLLSLQSRMAETQTRAAIDPTALIELQSLRAERQALQQQLQMLQQQLMMMSMERPRDVGLETMMMLMMMMQSQARANEDIMKRLYEQMLAERGSTEAAKLRDMIREMEEERRLLQEQIRMLQQQIEGMKAAPPPPRPAWYPGMIISTILGRLLVGQTLLRTEAII
ncbi:MAG: hypothetical protein QXL22_01075 [Candidatus Nezhaarchaeales archaeon]